MARWVFPGAEPDTDVVFVAGERSLEEHRVIRSDAAPASVRYAVRLGPALAGLRMKHGRVEAVDKRGLVAFHTAPAVAIDADRRVTEVRLEVSREDSWFVTASLDTRGLSFPAIVDPEWVFGPTWQEDQAVIALNSIWLRQNSATTGNVAVIDASAGPWLSSQTEAVLGIGALLSGSIQADSITVKDNGHITGDAAFNELSNNGGIDGTSTSSLTLPLAIAVPSAPSFTPGASPDDDVTLGFNEDLTIAAGAYGIIKLKQGSAADPTVLTLSGNSYDLLSLDVGDHGRVECAAACSIRIADKLRPGQNAFIGPQDGSGLGPEDIEIYVTGINGSSGALGATPEAAVIGFDNTVEARIFAPNGTLVLKQGTSATGRFIARDVHVGIGVTVTEDAGTDPGAPDCAAYCVALIAAGCANGPTSQSSCEQSCEADLETGFCTGSASALVSCANAVGSAQCDGQGNPSIAGCETEQNDHDTCVITCNAVQDQPCTVAECDCEPGSCDPQTAITYTPTPGASCSDGDGCNGDEICDANGACQPGTVVDSSDGNPCTADSCDPSTGIVSHTSLGAGASCADADLCDGDEICDGAGTCTAGEPPSLDDGNACTVGTCDPVGGVSHEPISAGTPCPDATVCNGDEICDGAGVCVAGTPLAIDDGLPCTVDSCDPSTGVSHSPAPAGSSCDDGDSCTISDACDSAGVCQPGPQIDVDDGDPCSHDSCDPVSGVTHDPASPGTSCGDSDVCDGEEICDGSGACVAGSAAAAAGIDCGSGLICDGTGACVGLPPDPVAVAPDVDGTVPTSVYDASAFLYAGASPVQSGVASGTIVPERAAVVRGGVFHRDTQLPVGGVAVSIVGHPELGQTFTRADGRYDLAVNGGGHVRLSFRKPGLASVQRRVEVPWQEYVVLEDVAMTPLDDVVSTIDFSAPIQLARGSVSVDADGPRQATIMFPQSVSATMVLQNDSIVTLPTLNVRITEYSVGPNGPQAMPEELPPTSGYTYAAALTADEELAADAKRVEFDQPIPYYVENFLGFPAGTIVPVGIFDSECGCWLPSDNGVIVEILGVADGLADLDVDGSGIAADLMTLETLGITDDEREQLANLYAVGASLWRARIKRFSGIDLNYKVSPDPGKPDPGPGPFGSSGSGSSGSGSGTGGGGGSGSGGVGGGNPTGAGPNSANADNDDSSDEDCEEEGQSVVRVQSQALREYIDVVGTPYRLSYSSERVPGRVEDGSLDIGIIGETVDPDLEKIILEVKVAGRQFVYDFDTPQPNDVFRFSWDGIDVYGRAARGSHPANIRLLYLYPAFYDEPATTPFSFGMTSPGGQLGPARAGFTAEHAVWKRDLVSVAGWHPQFADIGGWTVDVHHTYDHGAKAILRGDGTTQSASVTSGVVRRVAGGGATFPISGAAALDIQGDSILAMTVGADGSVYFSDARSCGVQVGRGVIWRVSEDGTLAHFGGRTSCAFQAGTGDGGPATLASFSNALNIAAGPDGAIYVSDLNTRRIRVIDPNGIVHAFVGNGAIGEIGDGGPGVTTAMLPLKLAVAPDGTVYFLANGTNAAHRVFRATPDGSYVQPFAGNGTAGIGGDGGRALEASFNNIRDVAVGPDGSVYVVHPSGSSSSLSLVRRISTDGVVTRVAGSSMSPSTPLGAGGPAVEAKFLGAVDVDLDALGNLYISAGRRVLVVSAGILHVLGGTGQLTGQSGGDEGSALAARIAPDRLAVHPDGSLLVRDTNPITIRAIEHVLPIFDGTPLRLSSSDGREVYEFTYAGRHVATYDSVSGATLWSFGYDADGRLSTITDQHGNTSVVQRDVEGNPLEIVGPFGQQTLLSLGADDMLASVDNPNGEAWSMTYHAGGLLATFERPRGNMSTYTYDTDGRLTNATDGTNEMTAYSRLSGIGTEGVFQQATPLGRTSSYDVTRTALGAEQRRNTFPSGVSASSLRNPDGTTMITLPSGTTISEATLPDPRFGMQSPVTTRTMTTPLGKTRVVSTSRAVTLSDPADPLSVATATETRAINGRAFSNVYIAATATWTLTTPLGRTLTRMLDAAGREIARSVGGLTPAETQYDAQGRVAQTTQGTRMTSYGYDAEGWLQSVSDPLTQTTLIGRDRTGRAVTVTRPDGKSVAQSYDLNGNLSTLAPPSRPAHMLSYDDRDLRTGYSPPDLGFSPRDTQWSYDADRALDVTSYPDGQLIDRDYDAAGRLSALTSDAETRTRSYDPLTGLIAEVVTPDVTLSYLYDGHLLTTIGWSGVVNGSVELGYDDEHRVVTETVNGLDPVSLGYDLDGLMVQGGALSLTRDTANGLVTGATLGQLDESVSHNGFGEPIGYAVSHLGVALYALDFDRDALGRITRKTETVGGVTTEYDYGYDAAGRLVQVDTDGVTSASWSYDDNGNRLSETTPAATTLGSYDDQDRLLSYGSKNYSYTENGDLASASDVLSSETTTYTYDAYGSLTAVTLPDGRLIEYVADGQNRRVQKRVDGVVDKSWLYRDALRPIAELDASGNVVARFVYATGRNVPDYMVKGGVTYRLVTDQVGSVRLVVDAASGLAAQRIDYDAWGNVLVDTSPGFQPFGFAGGVYDPDSGLERFGDRQYDSSTGRWTSKDPILISTWSSNPFEYASGDPINRVDPLGSFDAGTFIKAATAAQAAGEIALGASLNLFCLVLPFTLSSDAPEQQLTVELGLAAFTQICLLDREWLDVPEPNECSNPYRQDYAKCTGQGTLTDCFACCSFYFAGQKRNECNLACNNTFNP